MSIPAHVRIARLPKILVYCRTVQWTSPPLKSSTTQRLTIYAWNSPTFFPEKDLHALLYIAEAANTFPERAKLVVARAMLAHPSNIGKNVWEH
jgi:hypothetical protein